ncbi:sensor histidine kinase [Nocardia sp. A7]|uniref:sensor histidine kinase n=1 Tax=Nocardia sp. A7 TaxID=2789274 RepID=UPI00397946DE
MEKQPSRVRILRRCYAGCWVLLGLGPPVIAVHDRVDATKYSTWLLIAVLGAGYIALTLFPRNRVIGPTRFLCLLILVLGVTASLLDGGAAFFIVSLPLFWIYTPTPARAVGMTSAAAAATALGHLTGPNFSSGNAIFTVLGYAGGVLLGLWADQVMSQSTERTRILGAELARTQSDLAAAHQRQGAAEERERIARDIHDTLAQGFASIIVLAEAARDGIGTDPSAAAKQLRSIERTARENLTEARALFGGIASDGGGVAQTLRRVLDRFVEDTGLTVHAELADIVCDQPARIGLLRCTQESLANVSKHAKASTVGVVLSHTDAGFELEITDDGIGFTPQQARGFGLNGMRSRLAELGGEFAVTSSPGEGTRIFALLPAELT